MMFCSRKMKVLLGIAIMASISGVITQQHALFVRRDALANGAKRRVARQTSADQMVQNILHWLHGIYAQNSRKIRQGSFREYLPPTNTQKPRPFEPNGSGSSSEDNYVGYPPSGFIPHPPFTPEENQPILPPKEPFPMHKPTGFTLSSPGTTQFPGYPPAGATTGSSPQDSFSPATSVSTYSPPEMSTTLPPSTIPPSLPPATRPPSQTASSSEAPFTSETHGPKEGPSANDLLTSPGTTEAAAAAALDSESSGTADAEDLSHPPHIHAIDVECAKDMMTIDIEFNRRFDGIIYSKGFYTHPECRYVNAHSGQARFRFTVSLSSCGSEFVSAFDTQGQSYLENVLVLQNEAGIQEVWDTIRAVRCLWEGNLNRALSVALNVGMLTQEIVTFSGDTAMAKLDIQLGRGPFAPPANGLVKIGDTMTLVVTVTGDAGFDLQVKDCRARDAAGEQSVPLTDANGCVVKPKLFGAFQKTRSTGSTGASIIAYAFFSAFKFPDAMDLTIECNVELCKTDCEVCPDAGQKVEPGRRRRRSATNGTAADPVRMGKALRVILPEDLSDGEAIVNLAQRHDVCFSAQSFVFSFVVLVSLLVCSSVFSALQWQRNHRLQVKHSTRMQ